jgi:hypothetical protein
VYLCVYSLAAGVRFGAANAACQSAREGPGPLSAVVILSWDPAGCILEYVLVNRGAGGAIERVAVGEDDTADISVQLISQAGVAQGRGARGR